MSLSAERIAAHPDILAAIRRQSVAMNGAYNQACPASAPSREGLEAVTGSLSLHLDTLDGLDGGTRAARRKPG